MGSTATLTDSYKRPVTLVSARTILIFLRQLPIYFKFPKLFFLDFFLSYYFLFFYTDKAYFQEQIKTDLPQPDLTYGELPYDAFSQVLRHIRISPKSVFVDLGSGKGKLAFYMHLRYQIRAIGIEVIPTFVKACRAVVTHYNLKKISFIQNNYLTMNLQKGTLFFVSTTCLSNDSYRTLISRLTQLRVKSIVISTSQPLDHPDFKLAKTVPVTFSWGKGTVYIQKKIR